MHLTDGNGGHSGPGASICESLEASQSLSRARCCHGWQMTRVPKPSLCYVKTSSPDVKVRRRQWVKDSESPVGARLRSVPGYGTLLNALFGSITVLSLMF